MNPRDLDPGTIDRWRRASGAEEIEIYAKRGRSRRLVEEAGERFHLEADEEGWAVRANAGRGSFFVCGSGDPPASDGWPDPDGHPIRLPGPIESDEPEGAIRGDGTALASEGEIRSLAESLHREVERRLDRVRLSGLRIEDGQSESAIGNSLGILALTRRRVASLSLVGEVRGRRALRARLEWVERELSELSPRRLVSRLGDVLSVRREGRLVARDRCEVVVAPLVMTHLLVELLPLFDARSGGELVAGLGGPDGLGSAELDLVDDGRLSGGVLAATVDGEGTPTRETVLIERGSYRQPLLPWWDVRPGCRSGGVSRRDSWRQQPWVGPTHLYLRPDEEVRATELVASLSRGYYLLDPVSAARIDLEEDRFLLPVSGFEILGGRARRPITGVALTGRVTALLRGVRARARDLAFTPHAVGLIGSPSVRLAGLELLRIDG